MGNSFGSTAGSDILWNDASTASDGIDWAPAGQDISGLGSVATTAAASSGSSVLPALSSIAGLGSMALTSQGQINTAKATSEAASYNANIALMNSAMATQNAEWVGETGQQQVQKSQLETRQLVGATKADQAASGVDINSGSSRDVIASEEAMGTQNAINIRNSAARLAYGQQVTAAGEKAQASLDTSEAGQAMTAGQINSAGTILSGLANPQQNYLGFLQNKSLTG